jgi:hypothetical protein
MRVQQLGEVVEYHVPTGSLKVCNVERVLSNRSQVITSNGR